MQPEESLVRRVQRGEPEAFAQLYEAYFDKIYRYIVLKVGNQADAEDLTQQVFLKALESIGSFRWRDVPFSSWLFRIAHNQVVDYLRKRGKRKVLPLDEARTAAGADPALVAEHRLAMEQLMVASEHLTQAQREVISLRFAGELSTAEVAKVMGKSVGAVKALQHSALVALRRLLSSGR